MNAQLNAHYCYGKVVIADEMKPVGSFTVACRGIREARAIAKQYDARPWNF